MAKRYPAKLKFQVVLELLQGEKTSGQVAKAYGIHPNTAGKWKQQFLEKGAEVFNRKGVVADYERHMVSLDDLFGPEVTVAADFADIMGQTYMLKSGREVCCEGGVWVRGANQPIGFLEFYVGYLI